jgi:glutaminase
MTGVITQPSHKVSDFFQGQCGMKRVCEQLALVGVFVASIRIHQPIEFFQRIWPE